MADDINQGVANLQSFLNEPVPNLAAVGTANAEIINLLNKIVQNQEIDRKSYERSNPLITDSPIFDWLELSVPPGYLATFTLTVNEGVRFFFNYFNVTYRANTVYNIAIDGVTEPATTEPVMDWADHQIIFFPPRICQNYIIITALNNGNTTQTYGCFINGFFRQATQVSKEYIGAR